MFRGLFKLMICGHWVLMLTYGGTERYPLADGVEAVLLIDLCAEIAAG